MKKYLVITVIDGIQSATFRDDYTEAKNIMMDVECGLGGYTELYEYFPEGKEGELSGYVWIE